MFINLRGKYLEQYWILCCRWKGYENLLVIILEFVFLFMKLFPGAMFLVCKIAVRSSGLSFLTERQLSGKQSCTELFCCGSRSAAWEPPVLCFECSSRFLQVWSWTRTSRLGIPVTLALSCSPSILLPLSLRYYVTSYFPLWSPNSFLKWFWFFVFLCWNVDRHFLVLIVMCLVGEAVFISLIFLESETDNAVFCTWRLELLLTAFLTVANHVSSALSIPSYLFILFFFSGLYIKKFRVYDFTE